MVFLNILKNAKNFAKFERNFKKFMSYDNVSRFFQSPSTFAKYYNEEFCIKYDLLLCSKFQSIIQAINMNIIPYKIFVLDQEGKKKLLENTNKSIKDLIITTKREKIKNIINPNSKILAVFERPNNSTIISNRRKYLKINSNITILLNNIKKPQTLSSIIRTAAFTNIRQILLYNCMHIDNQKITENCIPATFMVPKYNIQNIERIIEDFLSPETNFHVPHITTTTINTHKSTDKTISYDLVTSNTNYFKDVEWFKGDHCIILSEPFTPVNKVLNDINLYYGKPLKTIANLIEIPFAFNAFAPTPSLYADIIFNETFQQNYQNYLKY